MTAIEQRHFFGVQLRSAQATPCSVRDNAVFRVGRLA